MYSLFKGFSHGFYGGNPFKLQEDIAELKPTFLVTVPRILNRIYQKIQENVEKQSAIKRYLFKRGVESKKYYLER